ncbi:MAG: hypothetical protein PHI19_02685, partial [Clostridia bacterium]|nr:hypothetical protein [Clostridia bacterium]
MTNRRTVKKTIYVVAIVLLIILPLVIGAGFVFWASADKSGGGYRFFEGLFGERYEAEQAYYTYDSQYASAKAVDPDFKSPVYVLGDSILENIPVSDYASRLPQNAVRELYIPADMRYEGIGLFSCYIDHNNDFAIQKTTTEAGLQLFDTSKPTLIFIHGMQLNDGSYKDENSSYLKPFIQGGYNVLLFRWSQLADESTPMEIEPKLWGTTQDKSKNLYGMRWRDNDPEHSYREDDIPNASVAEIFGAYYIDLMSRFDYTGRSIQLTGHSMGGQVAFAVASFLLTKEQEGLMPPAYLPDKVTVFDPYIAPFRNEVFCDWLGIHITRPMYDNEGNPVYSPKTNEQKYTSAINVIADTAQALTDRGIACEYVPAITGYVHFLLYGLDPNEPAVDKFFENCVVLNFRSDWAPKTDFNGFHGAGRNWYFQTVLRDYYYDHAMNNTIDYAPSANMPLSYFFARTGTKYDMQENMTKDD